MPAVDAAGPVPDGTVEGLEGWQAHALFAAVLYPHFLLGIQGTDSVWRGLTAPLTQQGRLSPLELAIWQMNQWWLAKMDG